MHDEGLPLKAPGCVMLDILPISPHVDHDGPRSRRHQPVPALDFIEGAGWMRCLLAVKAGGESHKPIACLEAGENSVGDAVPSGSVNSSQ